MMTVQEQEHYEFEAGRASEAQNCFEEAQLRIHQLSQRDAGKIADALAEGKFVLVEDVPYHCKATDAFAGTIRSFRAAFDSRGEAEAAGLAVYAKCGNDPDVLLSVLPVVVPANLPFPDEADEVPF